MPGLSAELVQQLYRTAPDRFVAARDAAVAEARQAGDPTTAGNWPGCVDRRWPPGW